MSSVFIVVLNPAFEEGVSENINNHYPINFEFSSTVFFVSAPDSTIPEDIAKKIGIKSLEGEGGAVLGAVFGLDGSYSGFTTRALWDWLARVQK